MQDNKEVKSTRDPEDNQDSVDLTPEIIAQINPQKTQKKTRNIQKS